MERVAAREKERERERTMQRDYAETREEFGSPAVDAEGKPYAPRGRVLTDQQLIDAGLAPYPHQIRAPSAVGHLPKLIKLGVPVPDEAVKLIERTEALRKELIEVRREIGQVERQREEGVREARREMIQQLTEGVSFEDAVLEIEDDGVDLDTLRAKSALVDSAVRQMTQKIEALTDQDTMWPILAKAHANSFVPDDFEATKAKIEKAERDGAKLRNAILN